MTPLKEDVSEAYRALFGREPESEHVVRQAQANHDSVVGLVLSLMRSEEYRLRTGGLLPSSGFDARPILERFRRGGEPRDGELLDWTGVRIRRGFAQSLGVRAPRIELDQLDEREALARAASLEAVEAAEGRFLVADIGAGWGRWGVAAAVAARIRGLDEIRVVAVEPQPDRMAHLRLHLADNGFDPDVHPPIEGVAAPFDGEAAFPAVYADDSSEAVAAFPGEERRPDVVYRPVRAYALRSILARLGGRADLCLVDFARSEAVLEEALPDLAAMTRTIIAGTGSRRQEAWLHDRLAQHGWRLRADAASLQGDAHGAAALRRGVQVWAAPAA